MTNHDALRNNTNEPAHAYRTFEPKALEQSKNQPTWKPGNPILPTFYISHGAPPLFEDAQWIKELNQWALSIPKPTGIVIISAHWEKAPITITAPNPNTGLTYDFGGFHPYYYTMKYPTPDSTQLGQQVTKILSPHREIHNQPSRGLDHGAWVPLKVMYPLADIPTVQVSIPTHNPETNIMLGKNLRELRQQGTLIIGSGFMTHGLPYITPAMIAGEYPNWSQEFDTWAWEAIQNNDIDTLSQYTKQAPGMPYAHPTVEHFTPLFTTLGAKHDNETPTTIINGSFWGLSKRSIQYN